MNTNKVKSPNLCERDFIRKYRIGTRFITALGAIYRYVKIDFGVVGHDSTTNKAFRDIQYAWIQTRVGR